MPHGYDWVSTEHDWTAPVDNVSVQPLTTWHRISQAWRRSEIGLTPSHGPLARYVNLRVVHAPGMPGTLSPSPRVSDPNIHHGTCVTHVLWCMPGSLTSGFLWRRWRGKRHRHSRRMRNPQFYVSGKRSILFYNTWFIYPGPSGINHMYHCVFFFKSKMLLANFCSGSNNPAPVEGA